MTPETDNAQESVATEVSHNIISISSGSGENEIDKLKLEIARKDLEYKDLQANCYLSPSNR